MSTNLYKEAIAEARQLREAAEQNAKNKIIEALTPQIRQLVENQIVLDEEAAYGKDYLSRTHKGGKGEEENPKLDFVEGDKMEEGDDVEETLSLEAEAAEGSKVAENKTSNALETMLEGIYLVDNNNKENNKMDKVENLLSLLEAYMTEEEVEEGMHKEGMHEDMDEGMHEEGMDEGMHEMDHGKKEGYHEGMHEEGMDEGAHEEGDLREQDEDDDDDVLELVDDEEVEVSDDVPDSVEDALDDLRDAIADAMQDEAEAAGEAAGEAAAAAAEDAAEEAAEEAAEGEEEVEEDEELELDLSSFKRDGDVVLEISESDIRRELAALRRNRRNRINESRKNRALPRKSAQLDEYRSANESLQSQLSEMKLYNVKLVYANKLLQNRNLTTRQQRAIVEALDKASTINEAKLLFQGIKSSVAKVNSKKSLKEGKVLGSSSKAVRSAAPAADTLNESAMDRWATLAGIKN